MPNFTFAFAFVILKVINLEIILFRFAIISVSMVFGHKFGESLGGSQAPPSFWNVPGLPPRKFPGDLPESSPALVARASWFSRYSTLSRYTPIQTPIALTFLLACKQNEGGVSHVKLPSEWYRTIGGYSSYSIALCCATKSPATSLEVLSLSHCGT